MLPTLVTCLIFATPPPPPPSDLASIHAIVTARFHAQHVTADVTHTTIHIASGVIVNTSRKATYILTSRHIVFDGDRPAAAITARLSDRQEYLAELGPVSSPQEDLALLAVAGGPTRHYARLAPADHCVEIEGVVATLGFRTGYRTGPVRGLSRSPRGFDYCCGFRSLQGDSGAGVFDGHYLIGLQAASDGRESFCIDLAQSQFIAQHVRPHHVTATKPTPSINTAKPRILDCQPFG